jgi:hypothetical protein
MNQSPLSAALACRPDANRTGTPRSSAETALRDASAATRQGSLRVARVIELGRRPAGWLQRWATERGAAYTSRWTAENDGAFPRHAAGVVAAETEQRSGWIVRLPPRWSSADGELLRSALAHQAEPPAAMLLLGSWGTHLGDRAAADAERQALALVAACGVRGFVLRLGNVIDPDGWAARGHWYPLLPTSVRTCCLTPAEVEAALDALLCQPPRSGRILTLLGPQRPLRDALHAVASEVSGRWRRPVAHGLALLQLGRAAAASAWALSRWAPALRRWFPQTLTPVSWAELVGLCHPLNRRHIALAGYNTGVVHFGWKYPERTVVKTTGCCRGLRVRGDELEADAGVTIRQATERLNKAGKQLLVRPNYSYVTLGTAFFVPIHGSGSEASVLGATIQSVLLYLPEEDRVVRLRRGETAFAARIFDMGGTPVLLRLRLSIRDQATYYRRTATLQRPSAEELWDAFLDPEASNIEIRSSHAQASGVDVCKYYDRPTADGESLAVPADAIGRLWDRIEENRFAAALFHAFVRRCGYHVELFLNRAEFAVFWRAHPRLPLSKIQLRFARRDGFPHSPCGDADRVTIDLFMSRRRRAEFQRFLAEHLPHAKFNRGKHSL